MNTKEKTERFEILENNLEVKDRKTGLVWRKDNKKDVTWDEALKYAASLGDDWRLPTIEELETLINKGRRNPASDFPDMPSESFWSSSSYVNYSGSAWGVYFGSGYAGYYYQTGAASARCVRDGESDGTV